MISDVEHLFMSFGHLYVLLGEVSIQVLCPFFNLVVCSLVLSFGSSLYILDINPLSDMLGNMFSHSVGCLNIFSFFVLFCFFAVQKPFSLM